MDKEEKDYTDQPDKTVTKTDNGVLSTLMNGWADAVQYNIEDKSSFNSAIPINDIFPNA